MPKPVKRRTRREPAIKWGPRLPAGSRLRDKISGRRPTRARPEFALTIHDRAGHEIAYLRVRKVPGHRRSDGVIDAYGEIRDGIENVLVSLNVSDAEWAAGEAEDRAIIARRRSTA